MVGARVGTLALSPGLAFALAFALALVSMDLAVPLKRCALTC